MRVFFEEVMFDSPGVVKAQTICQLYLLQRFLKQLLLGAICPRAWQLMLIENTKLHALSFHPAHGPSCPCVAYYAYAGSPSQRRSGRRAILIAYGDTVR